MDLSAVTLLALSHVPPLGMRVTLQGWAMRDPQLWIHFNSGELKHN